MSPSCSEADVSSSWLRLIKKGVYSPHYTTVRFALAPSTQTRICYVFLFPMVCHLSFCFCSLFSSYKLMGGMPSDVYNSVNVLVFIDSGQTVGALSLNLLCRTSSARGPWGGRTPESLAVLWRHESCKVQILSCPNFHVVPLYCYVWNGTAFIYYFAREMPVC